MDNTHLPNCLKLFSSSEKDPVKLQHRVPLSSQGAEQALFKLSAWVFRIKWLNAIFVIASTAKQWKTKHWNREGDTAHQQTAPLAMQHTTVAHLDGTICFYNLFLLDCISFLSLSYLPLLCQRWYRKYATAAMGRRAERYQIIPPTLWLSRAASPQN